MMKRINYTQRKLLCFLLLSLLSLVSSGVRAAQKPPLTVSGKVTDILGKPLPSVSVRLKGSAVGTVTNVNGDYKITVPSGDGTLVFTMLSFNTKEVIIQNRTTLDVQLEESNKSLEEVVVVGYGTRRKRDLTGSVSSVSAQQINQVVANNPVQAIQGRVAGVNVTQDGWQPGASSTVRIRGNRSITASNSPLYVIDGNVISRGDVTINDINTSDIASIEVLKDASATAIYGSRGANGVILITTKRGKIGATTVEINSYEGVQKPNRTIDMLDAAEYADYIRNSYRLTTSTNKYLSPTPNMAEDKANPQFALSPYVLESVLMGYDDAGNYDPKKVRGFDWMNAVLQTGHVQSHQFSIHGGSEKTKAAVSLSYFRNKGIVKNMDYNRYNINVNLDHQINNWLKVSTSTLVNIGQDGVGNNLYGIAKQVSPLASPYGADGKLLLYPANDPLMTNPLLDVEGVKNESRKIRALTNINLEATILPGLRFKSNLGYDYRTARDGVFQAGMTTIRNGGSDYASYGGNIMNDLLIENMFLYDKTVANNHRFNLTLLESTENYRFETSNASVQGLPYSAQEFYNLGSATTILGVGSRLEQTKMLSFMGRLNYDYKGKYLLTFTGRQDASSVLADGNKSEFFPTGALAWRISSEKFLQKLAFINDLKLRLSYGKVGNSSVAPYQTQGNLGLVRYVWDEATIIGYGPGLMPNPGLSWEESTSADAGLDFSLFNDRISGTVEVYQTNTSNLIMPRKLPISSGFPEVLANVGSSRNRGFEFNLNTQNIQKGDFRWSTTITFSANREEITNLVNGKVDDIGNLWFIGQPTSNLFYDLKFKGIWQNTPEDLAEMAKFNANGHNFVVGTIRLEDVNGDYRINSADRMILGNRRPNWTAGLSSDLNWRQFDFSFQFYTSQGGMGINDNGLVLNGRQNMVDVGYWTPNNPSKNVPKVNAGWLGPDYLGTLYYESTSFIRLKYVTLGYALPESICKDLHLKRFRIYASAQNPYLYSKFTGLDPEGAQGVTSPSTKTFTLGINASF